MIKIENLEKIYRTEEVETTALNKVNIEINEGLIDELMLDPLEDDASRRFKALFMCGLESAVEGTTRTAYFAVATSPDGCHWQLLPDRPVFGATIQNMFAVPQRRYS